MTRSRRIEARVSDAELKRIVALAAQCGLTLSNYLRRCALGHRPDRASAARTNLAGSQYVVTLHRDSRSGIAHLHIVANRVDMEGNVNDAHFIYERAMEAARRINIQRGWLTAEERS